MRRIVPALCAVVISGFMVPALAVEVRIGDLMESWDAVEDDVILGQTCLGNYGVEWSCEGPVMDGKAHGNWVMRHPDGSVTQGPVVDGKKHGNWVMRHPDGSVWKGPYVDGKVHGNWIVSYADGTVWKSPYVDGKAHGNWVVSYADGTVMEGPFVDGKKHGNWVTRYPTGSCHIYEWSAGEIVHIKSKDSC